MTTTTREAQQTTTQQAHESEHATVDVALEVLAVVALEDGDELNQVSLLALARADGVEGATVAACGRALRSLARRGLVTRARSDRGVMLFRYFATLEQREQLAAIMRDDSLSF